MVNLITQGLAQQESAKHQKNVKRNDEFILSITEIMKEAPVINPSTSKRTLGISWKE
jgi:hypothetical protein